MNKLVALALLAAATPAAAEPCDVRIRHAPDEVRAVVVRWLLDEERCGPSLDVRIVPTTDGLYVYARDANGRVRERTVPDAQSAGVLIASWAATDYEASEVPEGAMAVELDYAPAAPRTDNMSVERRYAPAKVRERSRPRTLALQLLTGEYAKGLRADLDVWRRDPVVFSATLSVARDQRTYYEPRGEDEIEFVDVGALASLALVGNNGPWQVRLAAGIGAVATRGTGTSYFFGDGNYRAYGHLDVLGVSPALELSMQVGVRLFGDWLVHGGPLITAHVQEYEVPTTMGHTTIEARGTELMFLGGVRHPL